MSRNPLIPGLAPKPDWCLRNCPRAYAEGVGFVPDFVGQHPKIAILLDRPTKSEATSRLAFTSGYARFFFSAVAKEIGLSKDDLIISYVLRCASWEYPTGRTRLLSEKACRSWDNKSIDRSGLPGVEGGLIKWDPNLFLITFGLDDVVEMSRNEKSKSDAFHSCMKDDFSKALRFAASGYRPMVMCGKNAMNIFPFTKQWKGGVKSWRGHWWEGNWPFTPEVATKKYDLPGIKQYISADQITAAVQPAPPGNSEQLGFEF